MVKEKVKKPQSELDHLLVELTLVDTVPELLSLVEQVQHYLEWQRLQQRPEVRGPVNILLLAEAPTQHHISTWRRWLARDIARHLGCRILLGEFPPNNLWVVGREDSGKIAQQLYALISSRVDFLRRVVNPAISGVKCYTARSMHYAWREALVHNIDAALDRGAESARRDLQMEQDGSLARELTLIKRWKRLNLLMKTAKLDRSRRNAKTEKKRLPSTETSLI